MGQVAAQGKLTGFPAVAGFFDENGTGVAFDRATSVLEGDWALTCTTNVLPPSELCHTFLVSWGPK